MKKNKVQGTQDFFGENYDLRIFFINQLKKIFELNNFNPLQTPSMEYLDLLEYNSREESNKLIYKILNSGDIYKKNENFSLKNICEKGLRYDLTIPMMRFLSCNISKINFPFKRYQIENVWRAERPQKGRYREFLQCDVDIVGERSYFCEFELINIAYSFFNKFFEKEFNLYINNVNFFKFGLKKINQEEKFFEIFLIVDKLGKISLEEIILELREKNFEEKVITFIKEFADENLQTNDDKIIFLKKYFEKDLEIQEKICFLEKILDLTKNLIDNDFIKIDLLLARGLDYYTDIIFEIKPKDKSIGSVASGGRYENMLKKIFDLKVNNFEDTAVGLSFGIDRILDFAKEKKFTKEKKEKILIIPIDEKYIDIALKLKNHFHSKDIIADLFLKKAKIKSGFDHAEKNEFNKVCVLGENEIKEKNICIKNILSKEEMILDFKNFI
jgi:histidyl-tRNA synthetase